MTAIANDAGLPRGLDNLDAPAPPVAAGGSLAQLQRPSDYRFTDDTWRPAWANVRLVDQIARAAHDRPEGVAALLSVPVAAADGAIAEAIMDYAKRVRQANVILGWFKRRCPLTPAIAETLGVHVGSSEQTVRRALLKLRAAYDTGMAVRKRLGLKPDATADEVVAATGEVQAARQRRGAAAAVEENREMNRDTPRAAGWSVGEEMADRREADARKKLQRMADKNKGEEESAPGRPAPLEPDANAE